MASPIYLDYCATTPIHPDVRQAVLSALEDRFGNPSSMHWGGMDAAQMLREARNQAGQSLNCSPDEIIFTSGATEANNLALFGLLRQHPPEKCHLITTSVEHHSILHTAQQLEREGYSVTYLPVDSQGLVSVEDVLAALRPETILVSVMLVNNEVGAIQPVGEIARVVHDHDVMMHTDAVQAIGLLDVDVSALGVDLLSLSAHKIYGPKGVGALYVRKGVRLTPLIYGGGQEKTLRPGTENMPGIVGLGAALELVQKHKSKERVRLENLRSYLIDGLQARIPGIIINGPAQSQAPHVLSVSFPGADAEMMLLHLNGSSVAVSMGSACTSQDIEPSHVLLAMGLSPEQSNATLRISFGYPTTTEELDCLLEILPQVWQKAQW